jgi:hypothetical protein
MLSTDLGVVVSQRLSPGVAEGIPGLLGQPVRVHVMAGSDVNKPP